VFVFRDIAKTTLKIEAQITTATQKKTPNQNQNPI
jgi:hypothetical protein